MLTGLALSTFSLSRLTRYELAEASMQPTLQPGDWVVSIRAPFPLRRGAVVTLEHPQRPGFTLVKRVVGLGGDTVAGRDGVLLVNGAVRHEPYAIGLLNDFTCSARPDELVVLSDNREVTSVDSRTLGPVMRSALSSRLLLRYHPWPPARVR